MQVLWFEQVQRLEGPFAELDASCGTTCWDDLWDDLWQRSMPAPDAAARHTGAGVARRQAHHERMRDERAREAAAGDAELPPEDDAVEMASAAQLLDSVAEAGPNYTLLRSKETKAKRRKRKREDARAALDGHTVLSTGSRLEIFCDSERWYPATVMAREEDGDGRIVHEVEYDGYSCRRWWHMLDDERWRAVPEQAGAGAGGAATDGDGDAAMDRADGEQGARAAGDAEAAEVRPAPPPVRRGVRRSALADALEAEDDEQQDEAARGDGRPMLAPHGPALSAHLRVVRLRLREFLATQAAAGKSVPMQRTALGLHPTMRWTIRFGKWLATTRIIAPRASRWHATERGDAREEEPTVRTGRGENTIYVALQHMKNHVWREIWPAMPSDARQYWRLVTKQVMSLYDGGGGGMKDAAGAAGRAAGREAARESASHGQSEAAQRAASERASAEASRRTMAELREATTKPCTRQHLFQVGEYQMQDTQLMEPFEVNVAFIMNAYLCFARQTGCRPGMAVNDAAAAADSDSPCRASPAERGRERRGGRRGVGA